MEFRIVKVIALVTLWLGATFGVQAQTVVEYVHTDALGTPVAITNAAGTVIERSVYEPNGQLINRPLTDGPGFTGHVQDAATGLTYMQQRYYDPSIGRFLSVDPVTANSGTGANFNRYWYANNNPYKFTDPDGRTGELALAGCALTVEIGCAPGAIVGGAIEVLIYVGAAIVIAAPIVINNEPIPETDSPDSDGPKTSDREPGNDGKRGSTGGPGAGKRFPKESPETKAGKEGVPCQYCGQETTNEPGQPNSRERDHIDPKSRGGNNSSENERDACRQCNRNKAAKNPDEWKPEEKK